MHEPAAMMSGLLSVVNARTRISSVICSSDDLELAPQAPVPECDYSSMFYRVVKSPSFSRLPRFRGAIGLPIEANVPHRDFIQATFCFPNYVLH